MQTEIGPTLATAFCNQASFPALVNEPVPTTYFVSVTPIDAVLKRQLPDIADTADEYG